jgi:hypothetical protein
LKAQKVCEQIIEDLTNLARNGYRIQVSRAELETVIMKHRGIDERTVNRWIKALKTFDMISEVAPKVFKINEFYLPTITETTQTKVM